MASTTALCVMMVSWVSFLCVTLTNMRTGRINDGNELFHYLFFEHCAMQVWKAMSSQYNFHRSGSFLPQGCKDQRACGHPRGCVKGGHIRNARLQKDPYICKIHGQGILSSMARRPSGSISRGVVLTTYVPDPRRTSSTRGKPTALRPPGSCFFPRQNVPELKFVGKLCTG